MRRALLAGLVGAAALLCLQACGDDADEVDTASSTATTRQTTPADCAALIPDSVLVGLGWAVSSPASLDSATCARAAAEGSVSTQRRSVAATGDDDLDAAAAAAYAERCESLSEGAAGTEVDWLGTGTRGCAVTTEDGRGVNVLLGLTPDSVLVESRVYPDAVTDASLVQQALVELVQTAAAQL